MTDEKFWDDRYSAAELVWSAGPNVFVEHTTASLPPGRMVDVAGGEGRNALWLASRGWDATLVDFSQVALDRARTLWAQRTPGDTSGRLETRHVDLLVDDVGFRDFDLVVVCYLQLPQAQRRLALQSAARAVGPNGTLVVVAHHSDNLTEGVGGPQDPAVLYTPDDVVSDLAEAGLGFSRADRAARPVMTDAGERIAWDTVVVAQRAEGGNGRDV